MAAAALTASFCTASVTAAVQGPDFRVLVFTKTAGFRHLSIPDGIALVEALGVEHNFAVDTTENAADFNLSNLQRYAAVIWLSTTGDVLDSSQQAAFEAYIQAGGGYAGVHSATDTEYDWPWYGELLGNGAWFLAHPAIQAATLHTEIGGHRSTRHLPPVFEFTDEWYNFQANPRPAVRVLLTIDEATYTPGFGAMGPDHPISWYHRFDGGRAWYTAMGHRTETFENAAFAQHLLGGILWVAGAPWPGDLDCDGVVDSFDIEPFILALTDPAEYAVRHPDCDRMNADVNGDGAVDSFDIEPFVDCLLSGGCE